MIKRVIFVLSAATILLAGCSHRATVPDVQNALQQENDPAQRLMQHFQQWRGTPYRLGGHSTGGIDCSGFVNVTYHQVFGMALPRTTKKQAQSGKKVRRGKLSTGDLVFFKTGFFRRHVGIYVGNNEFIHASTSQGVIRSSLHSPYWSRRYWKGIRITEL